MSKHYSKESLEEIAAGDPEFMSVVAQTFLDEIPPDLSSMEEAVANDNKELAYQFAHKMKPNLEMFGVALQKEISAVETWSKGSKSKEVISDQLEKIVTTLKQVFKELQSDFEL